MATPFLSFQMKPSADSIGGGWMPSMASTLRAPAASKYVPYAFVEPVLGSHIEKGPHSQAFSLVSMFPFMNRG